MSCVAFIAMWWVLGVHRGRRLTLLLRDLSSGGISMEVRIINTKWRVLEGKGNVCHEEHRRETPECHGVRKACSHRRRGLSWALRSGGT